MGQSQANKPFIEVVVAVVQRGEQILICQRRDDAEHLPGYWEFPGGKREAGESVEACVLRELLEELDLHAKVIREFAKIEHNYQTRQVRLIPVLCECSGGEPKPIGCQRIDWVKPHELHQYQFPPANDGLIAEVKAFFQRPKPSHPH